MLLSNYSKRNFTRRTWNSCRRMIQMKV